MRKFDDQDVPGANPDGTEPVLRLVMPRPLADARSASAEDLKALVSFAVRRGYHEHWNNAAGLATPCKK